MSNSDSTTKFVTIHRATEGPYFPLRRNTAQDKRLSWEAHGVLDYLLSKPVDWIVRPKDLERPGCGRDKVYKILNELIGAGYVTRTVIQNAAKRYSSVVYAVYEIPLPEIPDTVDQDITEERLYMDDGDSSLPYFDPSDDIPF